MRAVGLTLLLLFGGLPSSAGRLPNSLRPVAEDQVKDRFIPAAYDRQRIRGLLGERMRVNLEGWLLHVDEAALLGGFQYRPGKHPRIGEHIGKFLDAASNTWAYTGDERLRALMDRLVRGLIATQMPDGYLGTYTADQRWTGWDVWVHNHDLIGLLRYYQVTGYRPALDASRRIGDLLTRTFGPGTDRRDILQSGNHLGLTATSVLEPLCMLFRYTDERRNLSSSIIRAYDRPDGPKIIRSLVETDSVYRTANGKAYELLSNLIGLVELYQLSGDEAYLKPALIAWKDIVTKRLYITGTAGSGEYFKDDFVLPGEESARVGEGCTTVAWLQFTWHLLRLTGEPQYADELERTIYNQLLGAQDPYNGEACSFTPLVGRKRPAGGLNCCASSQSRGISMIPQMVWGTREGGPAVLLYAPGEVTLAVRASDGALEVGLKSETRFPLDGAVALTLEPSRPARFPVFLRVPSWCTRYTASVNGTTVSGEPGRFLRLERTWQRGDRIEIKMDLTVQVLPGGKSYRQFLAIQRGPQVLALERSLNPGLPFLHRAAPASPGEIQLADAAKRLPGNWPGAQAYSIQGITADRPVRGVQTVTRKELILVPFADARDYRVWLVKPDKIPLGPVSLTSFGAESWSREGNVEGSICDERPDTFRTSFQGAPAKEDWYAVEMDRPETIARVVYRHGKLFPNGGWFDTATGKPEIQVKRARDGPWETVATLSSYPDASNGRPPDLQDGQPFEAKLRQPLRAVGIRVVGHPGKAFSSCAELAGYEQ